MRRLIPRSRMGKFAVVVAFLWLVKLIFYPPGMRYSFPLWSLILDLIILLLAVPALYYSWKLFRFLRKRLFWKIRRRLIVAYIFIGAIPILLIVAIFYASAFLIYYQLSYFLTANQIWMHVAQIHAFNLSLRDRLQDLIAADPTPSLGQIRNEFDADSRYLLGLYPSAIIIFRFTDPITNNLITYSNRNLSSRLLEQYQIPRWLANKEFSGLVQEDLQPQLYEGRLFLRSLAASDFTSEVPFTLEVSVPFDRYLMERLKAALGLDFLLARQVAGRGIKELRQSAEMLRNHIIDSTLELEDRQALSNPVWSLLLFPTSWSTGMETTGDSEELLVELSTSKLMRNVFRSESAVGKAILSILKAIVVFFLLVEIISIVIGIVLTKSITNAVHNLDRGTEFLKRGDFSQRIVVKSDDQLGALAASFNQMTEYVQQLIKERVEKERLERELEIAKEVQQRLFPNRAPQMTRMNITGVCLPARVVSGDYYDFLLLGDKVLGVAVGDICGKGISAALLMSNLQATLRSNVMNLWQPHNLNTEKAVAQVVQKLNSQFCTFTSDNKYATFFYAVYDDIL